MPTSLNEETVERDESLERDAAIVNPVRTVLLHHSLQTAHKRGIQG